MAAAVGAPTVFYCHRKAGVILVLRPGTDPVILASSGDGSPFGQYALQPFGLALDAASRTLWCADKLTNRIWKFGLEPVPTGDGGSYRAAQADCVEHRELQSPCTMDWHPKYGLLIACFGSHFDSGGVWLFRDSQVARLDGLPTRACVTHCCWLPGGQYCFVERQRSELWVGSVEEGGRPVAVEGTVDCGCGAAAGAAPWVLGYVQGLCWSASRRAILIADAEHQVLLQIKLADRFPGTVVWRGGNGEAQPGLGTRLCPSGVFRALAETPAGELVWMESRGVFALSGGQVRSWGPAAPEGLSADVVSSGMVVLP